MYINVLKYSCFWAVIFLLLTACDTDRSSIPDTPVYLERNINAEALELRTIGGFKTYTLAERYGDAVGFGGLLIINGFDEKLYAFDLACPYEVDRTIVVVPNESGQAVCSGCGSVFSIGYGSGNRISGKAEEGLRKYNVNTTQTVTGITFRITK